MTQMNIAVRAANRILSEKNDILSEAYDMDRQFDHGEFCGQAYGKMYDEAQEDTIKYVAERFEISYKDLENALLAYWYSEPHFNY